MFFYLTNWPLNAIDVKTKQNKIKTRVKVSLNLNIISYERKSFFTQPSFSSLSRKTRKKEKISG